MAAKKKGASTFMAVIGILLCVLFGAALIMNLTIIIKGFTDPNNPPSVFGITPMVVQSGSMSIWNDADDHSAGNVVHKVFPDQVADLSRDQVANLKKGDIIWSYEEDYKVRNEVQGVVNGDNGMWVNTIRLAEDHIEVGDMIFSKKIDVNELKVGDVISFLEDSVVVTHRIIRVNTEEDGTLSFTTKGDANLATDTVPVPQDKVIGIYAGRVEKVGDFAMFMQTPLGMLLFIGVPLLGFILYDIIRRQRAAAKASSQDSDLAREKEEMEKKAAEMQAELERLRSLAGEKAAEAAPVKEEAPVEEAPAEVEEAPAEEAPTEEAPTEEDTSADGQ